MATNPSSTEKFIGLSASVDTTERRSAMINAESQAYELPQLGFAFVKEAPNGYINNYRPNIVSSTFGDSISGFINPIGNFSFQSYPIYYTPLKTYGSGYSMIFGAYSQLIIESQGIYPLMNEVVVDGEEASNIALFFEGIGAVPTTISFPNATTIFDTLYFTDNIRYSAPNLVKVMSLSANTTETIDFSFPKLEYAGSIGVQSSNVTSIDFPLLKESGIIEIYNQDSRNIVFPNLKNVSQFISAFAIVGSTINIDLPSLESVWRIDCYNGNVSTFNFPKIEFVSKDVSFYGCKLTQASVDHILTKLAAIDGSVNGYKYSRRTVDLSGGTNATPSAAGLAAAAILVSRGCTVTYN